MNLKEAFRFQNKLQSMMTDAQSILGNNGNITKVQNTYLRHKVMAEAEDEVTMEAPSTEYSENITEMAEFLLFLLNEREKLSAAIHQLALWERAPVTKRLARFLRGSHGTMRDRLLRQTFDHN